MLFDLLKDEVCNKYFKANHEKIFFFIKLYGYVLNKRNVFVCEINMTINGFET